ncbi:zinc-finger homeodomain protein 6 [Nicotiana tabacum]|uniref:Zinc-finger homeodomain protein 5 n=2 Tax=Nicotiana TaxID=4085 RepID=A0A1S3XD31_TOBAC|nr:PREDICTED: zinc-finger homeodomain protein 5-like [Nicotiana sylvestris]XP_016437739.1 PREDICTED: zinc-finger homeodomain protein 5-like [Nicotiana tabacum]
MQGDKANDNIYRECLRNHAASLGSYATDGCGEFTLDDNNNNNTSPRSASLHCAACGCHRNFHRKVMYGASYSNNSSRDREIVAAELTDYGGGRMSAALTAEESPRSGKKRFRTKFTTDQKEKMLAFAEKLGWTLQRKDQENETERFCREVGVSRKVFKVWMHNHKNNTSSVSTGNASSLTQ